MSRATPAERFAKFVKRDGEHLLWVGGNNGRGYGQFWDGTRRVYAHRFSYEQEHGPIPLGLELDHLCRVTLCIEPSHLEPVTHAENIRRGAVTGCVTFQRNKTHCPQGHEYNEANTYRPPNGDRVCRKCYRKSA